MKKLVSAMVVGLAATTGAQDFLDRIDQSLSFSALDDQVRARVSGAFDLEFYHFDLPPPGLINSTSADVVNPRLTLFLDGQAGSQMYLFIQARFDRGFDPSDNGARASLDEYAIRFTPWEDGRLSIQIGKFATVVGNFVSRHLSWENQFINSPLPYENLTRIEDRTGQLANNFQHALLTEKYEFIPIIWGPNYTSGISIAGHIQQFDYAFEVKNTALSSRPEVWDVTQTGFAHPTFSGRVGYRPSQLWNFGFSASDGSYLASQAEASLPRGSSLGDFREKVLGQDASFAWHHLQLWAEFYEARFDLPRAGTGDSFAWYLEGKYRFTPQWSAGLRWNQQLFGKIDNRAGGGNSLGPDTWRVDAAVAYRITEHMQVKLQYSFQEQDNGDSDQNNLFGAQFTVRF